MSKWPTEKYAPQIVVVNYLMISKITELTITLDFKEKYLLFFHRFASLALHEAECRVMVLDFLCPHRPQFMDHHLKECLVISMK